MKLKIDMLYHMNNTFRNNVLQISVNVSLKSLKFKNKDNYFQTIAASFIRLPYLLEKGENISKKFTSHNSIETR